ncbi:MAG: hypothetical protein DMG30_29845 [Acidobacteria bacterium]|nr:MAG: hypothetical protein DMG30_29845 [Acidobacteriota bacterium]
MRVKPPVVLVAILALLGAALPTFAHHGFGVEFDKTKCMDLKGTLTGIDWENPHAYIHMDVKDARGKMVSWSLETVTPLGMKRSGTTREDFLNNVGKPILVRACPTKAGGTEYRGAAEFLKLPDGLLRIVGQNVEGLTPEQLHF